MCDIKYINIERVKDVINSYYGMAASHRPSHDYFADCLRYCLNDAYVTEELLRKQFMEEKEMSRKVTLIGSMKHKDVMMEIYNKLTLRGDCVLLPYMGIVPEDANEDTIEILHDLHRDKMLMADFVVVVDKDGYIGKDTLAEIKWCENQGKRIIYASDFAMLDDSQPSKSKK